MIKKFTVIIDPCEQIYSISEQKIKYVKNTVYFFLLYSLYFCNKIFIPNFNICTCCVFRLF